ncbi:MAG: TRAP transporter substrate-binding protein [Rhodospirillales bacterium]|nr:TRAP transporter substrate-binding protein [Rhodospirillales bacterium]
MKKFFTTVASGCALTLAAGQAQAVELTLAHHDSLASINTHMADSFIDCVQGQTETTFNHLPAAQMGTAREIIEQLKLGALQMSSTDVGMLSAMEPSLAVVLWPFMMKDFDHAEAVMNGAPGKYIRDLMLKNHGIRIVAYLHNGFRDFLTVDKPITGLADIKGVKFRSPSHPVFLGMFKALKAEPVPVPWSEAYTAMQTKLVDAMETGPEGMVNSKMYEVGKHVVKSGHIYGMMTLVIREDVYQKLDGTTQKAFASCGAKYTKEGNAEFRNRTDKAYKFLADKGLTVSDIDKGPLQKALKPVWGDLQKDLDPKISQELIDLIQNAAK